MPNEDQNHFVGWGRLTAAGRDCPRVLLHFPSAFLEEQRFSHLCSIFFFFFFLFMSLLFPFFQLFPILHFFLIPFFFLQNFPVTVTAWGTFSWFNFGMGGPGWCSSGRNLLGGALDLILVNSGSSCGWASSGTVKSVCLCGTPQWFHS